MFNVEGRYTYHHHTRNDKLIGSKRVHQEKEKVYDGDKEVHWKSLQKNKIGTVTSSRVGLRKEKPL
jgi:hypothetical protein